MKVDIIGEDEVTKAVIKRLLKDLRSDILLPFIENVWDFGLASDNSTSLRKAIDRIKGYKI
jgi:hypothetical protein